MAIRYDERNCHGQSSVHNARMAGIFGPEWRRLTEDKYNRFMLYKYGPEVLDELNTLARTPYARSVVEWIDLARELYSKCMAFSSKATEERLSQVYRRLKEKRILELIMKKIKEDKDAKTL